MLLAEAEEHTENESAERTQRRDEPTLQEEDAADSGFIGTEVRKDADVLALVEDEHRERTNQIEAGDEQDENHQQHGQPFLHSQNAEEIGLLLVAVENLVPGPQGFGYL